jgi:chemotaxis protein MotB
MARERPEPPQDEDPGAPEWMVTFSDCMTLLLTIFVLLLTFSSFDERVFKKLRVIYCDAFPTIHQRKRASKESLLEIEQLRYVEDLDKGSEKPTYEDGSEGALIETYANDYKKHKVFLIRSDEVFWGKGTAMSQQGREMLSTFARFIKDMPENVVISENDSQQNSPDLSMARAWAVIRYLTKTQGLDINRFSISAGSTIGQTAFELFSLEEQDNQPQRLIEIVLLQRSLCN